MDEKCLLVPARAAPQTVPMFALVVVVLGVTEPHSGVKLDVPPEFRCIYIPSGPLAEECGPIDLERLAAMKAEMFVFAIDPVTGAILIGKTLPAPNAGSMTEEALDTFPNGVVHGMRNLGTFKPVAREGHLHWLEHHGGLTLASYELNADADTRAKHPGHGWAGGAIIPAQKELISLMVTGPERSDLMERVVLSLQAPPDYRKDVLFGTGNAFQLGELFGRFMGGCVFVIACIVGLWRLVRRRPSAQ